MFVYRSRFLTRGEVWFDDEPDGTPVDWVCYRQRSQPVPKARSRPFYTLLIDLDKSPGDLWSEMSPGTVHKIRHAQNVDHTRWESCAPSQSHLLDDIEDRWNAFAAARHSPPLDRPWFEQLLAAGVLVITAAKEPQGAVLAYHVNYLAGPRAQQLIIVSQYRRQPDAAFRGLVNRANCLGHWHSLLTLRERGARYFDFGGWYTGTTNMEMLGMNAFKKGFGGQVVCTYACEQILTLKGWIVLTASRWLARC